MTIGRFELWLLYDVGYFGQMINAIRMSVNMMNTNKKGEDDMVLLMKRMNSNVILQCKRGSMNDITLEWGCISMIFWIIDI